MKYILVFFALYLSSSATAQVPDHIYAPNIHAIKFNVSGNPMAYPIWTVNGADRMELHFDDSNGGVRNYSYTYLLCNADWSQVLLSQFDYIQGFSQMRITTYRVSSIALTKYTHYQAMLPDRSCMPSRSGNYLLKVFSDGDTSKVLFSRRFLVVKPGVDIAAQIQQPFNGQFSEPTRKFSSASTPAG